MPDETPEHVEQAQEANPKASGATRRLTPEQFDRWASLIGEGKADVPTDLEPDQTEALIWRVRAIRRKSLLALIARNIALDISRTKSGGPPC